MTRLFRIAAIGALTLLAAPALAQSGAVPGERAAGDSGVASDAVHPAPAERKDSPPTVGGGVDGGRLATEAGAEALMAREVLGGDGETLGMVEDILIDPAAGDVRQLVIARGGLLGIGAREVAVPFDHANLAQREDGAIILSNLTRATFDRLPPHEDDGDMVSLGR